MQAQQQIRFTPEEIKALVESGELNEETFGLLHPADQKVAQTLLTKPSGPPEPEGFKIRIRPGSGLSRIGQDNYSGIDASPEMQNLAQMIGGLMTMGRRPGGSVETGSIKPSRSPVERMPPSSDPVGVGDNVHRGVTNDFGGRRVTLRSPGNPDKINPTGRSAESQAFSRPAPKNVQRGSTNTPHDRMPVGSKADYAGWSAKQDSKFPPQDATIEDLLKKLHASLGKRTSR